MSQYSKKNSLRILKLNLRFPTISFSILRFTEHVMHPHKGFLLPACPSPECLLPLLWLVRGHFALSLSVYKPNSPTGLCSLYVHMNVLLIFRVPETSTLHDGCLINVC